MLIGKGIELTEETMSANVIHFAVHHAIPAVQFEKLLELSMKAPNVNIKEYVHNVAPEEVGPYVCNWPLHTWYRFSSTSPPNY